VDGFFLLSGFLIVQSWTRDPDPRRFLTKRVLRIYPAFIVASMVSVFLVGWIGRTPGHYLDGFQIGRFVKGLLFLNQPKLDYVFAGTHHDVVNGALWTIQYEFRCYLLVAALGLCGIFRHRVAWIVFAFGSVVAYGIVAIVNWLTAHPVGGGTTNMFKFVAFFAMGGAFYLCRERVQYRAGWVALAAVIALASLLNPAALALVLPTIGAYVFFGLAFAKVDWLSRSRIGADISYGTYLYGWPAQKVLLWYWPGLGPWTLFVLATAVAMGLGWVSWNLVEQPFLKLKPRGHMHGRR
jgi:peptidoglycan/LPS O-acetylase OafA/YrhL